MRILLTGASGQLGAYLIDRLLARGHDVDALSGTTRGDRHGVPLTPVDLADRDATARALDRVDPDAVLHAAAVGSAEAVRLDPVGSSRINVDATIQIAGWCDRLDRRLVFTSTDLVFGRQPRPWNREDDPAEPLLAYGADQATRRSLLSWPLSNGLVARLSLLYGPSRCGRPATSSTRRSGPCEAGEPRDRSSRTNIGPRSTCRDGGRRAGRARRESGLTGLIPRRRRASG